MSQPVSVAPTAPVAAPSPASDSLHLTPALSPGSVLTRGPPTPVSVDLASIADNGDNGSRCIRWLLIMAVTLTIVSEWVSNCLTAHQHNTDDRYSYNCSGYWLSERTVSTRSCFYVLLFLFCHRYWLALL